jgi:phosphoribosylanthranilate isomerase
MIVKICGITRRDDAAVAVEAGASALGFIFHPASPRFVTPEQAAKLGEGLPAWKVGVFVNETAASIEAVVRAAKLDVAQIYDSEVPTGVRVWKAIRVTGPLRPDAAQDAEALLVDGPANGVQFDWSHIPRGNKVILAGGLNPENVEQAILAVRPWGVDASSGLESAPGIKDHRKVMEFVEKARKAAV